ncbi:MAG: DegQ family serine endoprotease [Magnetococcales bacterium]|nr:DegQ family serine endoprotease [Magnetococcales bacterium]
MTAGAAMATLLLSSWGAQAGGWGGPELVELVKRLKPVVVNISATQKTHLGGNGKNGGEGGMPGNPFEGTPYEDLLKRFFDMMPEDQAFKSSSLGSGVIIDKEGLILTNNHVVEEADNITVKLFDDREFPAEVVGRDAKTDLALIRIEPKGDLPVARLGDSDKAEVGSWVVAIGNPFGLEATVTTGIISARGRVIGSGPYDNFLQTDAAINPGNSGGPLFNTEGDVVGINTAIYSRSGGSMGIGFAIPVNLAKTVAPQLKASGKVVRGWLGVRIQSMNKELAEAMGLSGKAGALVASVDAESPAEKGGLRTGDVILKFDGKEVNRMRELPTLVAETPVGRDAPVEVVRDGKTVHLSIKVGEMKEEESEVALLKDKSGKKSDKPEQTEVLGMTARDLTPELRRQLEVKEPVKGVYIANVAPDSEAFKAGIRRGDVITEINRKPTPSTSELVKAAKGLNKGQKALILLMRGGEPLFLALDVK